jgi:arylformamidase
MKSYRDYDPATLARLYDPEAGVADAAECRERYKAESDRVRSYLKSRLDVAYGPAPDQRLDLYLTDRERAPILVFIHGGGWRASNKRERAFPALPLARAGAIFISVEYPLAPGITLDEMVRQVREAIVWIHRNAATIGGDPNRIHLSGNSAGGHLGAILLATEWRDHGLPENALAGACLVSGVFDMRPIRFTSYNEALRLDEETAARFSPLLHLPERGCPLIVAVGRDETTEFVRQSVEFFEAWVEKGFHGELIVMPKLHHFSIIGELGNPASPLFQAILNQMGLGPRPR